MSEILHTRAVQLQDYCNKLRQEYRTAQILCEKLRMARQYAEPAEIEYLDDLVRRAERIEDYFREMEKHTDKMYTEFGLLSHGIGIMLKDNPHWYDRFAR